MYCIQTTLKVMMVVGRGKFNFAICPLELGDKQAGHQTKRWVLEGDHW